MRQRLSYSLMDALGIGDWFKTEDEVDAAKYAPEIKLIGDFFNAVEREMRSNGDVLALVQFVRNEDDPMVDGAAHDEAVADAKAAVARVLGRVEDIAKAHMRRFRPEVLKEVTKGRHLDIFRPTQILDYIDGLHDRAALTLKKGARPTLFLKELGVSLRAFDTADYRIHLASKVNPWTAMDPALNDLIRAYWSKGIEPKDWDETRAALVGQGINPDDWRPPVRERTAAILSFPRPGKVPKPVAYDLPADAALDNGMAGPIRVGNVVVAAQEPLVRVAGTVRIVPIGWSGVSVDAEYAVLVGLRLNEVETNPATGRYVKVTGKGTYEVSHSTGEVRTVTLHVKGVLTASPLLMSAMSDADLTGTARVAAAKGLYGFTSSVEKTAGVANRRLAREAAGIARAAMKKDAGVVDFLKTHAKREGSRPAKVLLAALKESLPRVAAAAEVGMYGHKARTAEVGIRACADVRLAAGRIAAELHGRKGGEHERITSFLKMHSAKGKCAYSGMILSCYPDVPVADVPPEVAPPRLASERVPSSVRGWLTSED
jgi:hypothetical protein